MSDFLTGLRAEVVAAQASRRRPRVWAVTQARPALAVAVAVLAVLTAVLAIRALTAPVAAGPRVIERFDVGGIPVSGAFDGRLVWIADTSRRRLLGLEPRRGRVVARLRVAGSPDAVSVDPFGRTWLRAGTEAGHASTVARVAGDAVVPVLNTGHGTALAFAAGSVWTNRLQIRPEGLDGHDLRTGRRTHRLALPGIQVLQAARDTLWAIGPAGEVLRIDARTGRVVGRTAAALAVDAGLDMTVDASGAWIVTPGAAPGDGALLHVGARGVDRQFALPGAVVRVVARSGDGLWTATGDSARGDHRLLRVDPRTGRVTARVAIGEHRPTALIVVDDRLWVTCGDGSVLVVAAAG
jgi:outer membrane protein assembly factor BamB